MSKEFLTSRQRVINAVEHKAVDRMPIDLGAHTSTGISAFAYYNLRKYLGLSTDNIEMVDCVQNLARVDDDIIERFHIDTVFLNPTWENPKIWKPFGDYSFKVSPLFNAKLQDNGSYKMELKGETLYMPKGGFFFDGGWPDFYDYATAEQKVDAFAKRAEMLYNNTDKYIMLTGFFFGFFDGLEFACDMLTDPEICIEHNEAFLKKQIELFDLVNKKMGKYLNCVEINSDLGTQTSLMCTPDSYEEIVYPYLKRFCEHIHNTSNLHIFMHSCGSISKLLDYIADAGVNIINPVQISASDMEPSYLKEKFGKKLCFWGGGCDTQSILNNASVDQITQHVAENIAIFKKDSGFVFNQVHNIMGDIAPEKIVALYDTAYKHSFY